MSEHDTDGGGIESAGSARDRLLNFGSATLGECGALILDPAIRHMWRGAAFSGPAFTVRCAPGDNLAIHAAVARAPRGCVLAVSVTDQTVRGYWGEVLTIAAMTAGIAAFLIDGHVRDIAAIESHRFPVFARGTALRGASKRGPGEIGAAAVVGGVLVRTGDWLVGDADGVVCVPAARLGECQAAAARRAEAERGYLQRIRAGETTAQLLALDLGSIAGT